MLARLIEFTRRPPILAAVAVLGLRVLTLASRFVLSLLLARMLSAEEVGHYGLLTAVLSFLLLSVGLEF